ncbi:DNA ligase, partial [Candidatus Saccharibacteria bacterium]|nr:DNA ligase [Candidatus Saccharibacteria bacterium]
MAEALGDQPAVKISEYLTGRGKKFFEAAKSEGLEGIMAKKRNSIYRPGARVRDWLKIKNLQQQEAVIGGFTKPQRGRLGFGALVLGVYEQDKLVYIGHVGGGFDEQSLAWIERLLRPLAQSTS